jgi:hypothetical protein
VTLIRTKLTKWLSVGLLATLALTSLSACGKSVDTESQDYKSGAEMAYASLMNPPYGADISENNRRALADPAAYCYDLRKWLESEYTPDNVDNWQAGCEWFLTELGG